MQVSRNPNAPLQTRERPIEVLFTERAVRSSEAPNQVPTGYRMASPHEVSLKWKTDSKFRERLYQLPCAVWTGQTGLKSSGPHKIDDNGNYVRITGTEFNALDAKDKSWHYPGNSLVALDGFVVRLWLGVDADIRQDVACRVAYVKLDEPKPQIADVLRSETVETPYILLITQPNGKKTEVKVESGATVEHKPLELN
jgi:hypothetical protein